jgi:integrase/recombinase XerC
MPTPNFPEEMSDSETDLVFLENGRPAELPGFDPYFGRWISQLRAEGKKHSTLCTYEHALLNCISTLQSTCNLELTARTFTTLKREIFTRLQQQMLEEGAADRTVRVRMAALRSFGKLLARSGHVQCNTRLVTKSVGLGHGALHTPKKEDCNNLVTVSFDRPEGATWETVRDRAILRLFSAHGLTISEVLAIDREHLCLSGRTLNVLGRAGPRTIAVKAQVLEEITAYLQACPYDIENGSPLFRGTHGARLVARVVQLNTQTLRNQLGLHESTTPRTIRKSLVLQLVADGVPTQEIMQRVGLSGAAMGAILRESPLSPLEFEKRLRKASSIMESLRPRSATTSVETNKRAKGPPKLPR